LIRRARFNYVAPPCRFARIDNVYLGIEPHKAAELRDLTSTRQRDYNRHGAHEVQVDALNSAPVTFARTLQRFVRQFAADARFYHGLTRAGPGSLALTALRNRGLWLLTSHRIAHFCLRRRNVRSPIWWIARLCKSFGAGFNVLCCRSQFAEDCEIHGVAYLSNHGYLLCSALSIGSGSLIHDRCTFGHSVAGGGAGRPAIGKDVWIGSDCVIAGSLTVGDGATVLPGTVLTFSVLPRAVVKGNPARIVRTDFDNSQLRRSLRIVLDVATDNL
jgi:acetyltransferase-like isoleucine patch superfamily enzyme